MKPGIYTFQQVLDQFGIELPEDRRRIKVGGLGFDSPDQTFRVPETTAKLEITLDSEVVKTVNIK